MKSVQSTSWGLLGVPIDCLAQPGGTEDAPEALRAAGLAERADLADLGDTEIRLRLNKRDPASGILAAGDVVAMTREVRVATAAAAAPEQPLLVIGGCCTLVPGVVGGLRDRGEDVGLVYLDGHLDLYDGSTSPTGEAADMSLAVLLGRGPAVWEAAAGTGGALLDPRDVTLLGPRDLDEARKLGSPEPADLPGLTFADTAAIERDDPASLGARTARRVAHEHRDGYWVHLDLDILDEQAFPATDYLSPGGLDWATLSALLIPLTRHRACRGLDVVCFNPDKDLDGAGARQIVQLVGEGLR